MTEKHTVKEDTDKFSNNIIRSNIQDFDPSKAHGHDKEQKLHAQNLWQLNLQAIRNHLFFDLLLFQLSLISIFLHYVK